MRRGASGRKRGTRRRAGRVHVSSGRQEFATLSDQYAAEISKLDEQCKELRKDQKGVKECHEAGRRVARSMT